jgi:hypothetical protein
MAAKLIKLTHKIAIQLHLVAESYTICSSRCRRPVRKLLDTLSYFNKYSLSNSTEQRHPSKAKSRSAGLEITRLLWNRKVHYRVHKCLPLASIQRQMNPVHTFPHYSSKLHFNGLPLCIGLPGGLFPSGLQTKILHAFLTSYVLQALTNNVYELP